MDYGAILQFVPSHQYSWNRNYDEYSLNTQLYGMESCESNNKPAIWECYLLTTNLRWLGDGANGIVLPTLINQFVSETIDQ